MFVRDLCAVTQTRGPSISLYVLCYFDAFLCFLPLVIHPGNHFVSSYGDFPPAALFYSDVLFHHVDATEFLRPLSNVWSSGDVRDFATSVRQREKNTQK